MPTVLITASTVINQKTPGMAQFLFCGKKAFIQNSHGLVLSENERRYYYAKLCYEVMRENGYTFTCKHKTICGSNTAVAPKQDKNSKRAPHQIMPCFKVIKLISEYFAKKFSYESLDSPHPSPEKEPIPISSYTANDILLGRGSGGTLERLSCVAPSLARGSVP